MAAQFLEFDLHRELEQLRAEPGWSTGHNAKTLAKYEDFRVVLITIKTGARIPEHQTRGRISIQTFAGHVLLRAEGRTFDLPAGTFVTLDHDIPHHVEALEDSAILLTIAWPATAADR